MQAHNLASGGSFARTRLLSAPKGKIIRKLARGRHAQKLHQQYDWLLLHAHLPHLPKVLAFREKLLNSAFYSCLDLEYFEHSRSFHDFIHSEPIDSSRNILQQVLALLERIHGHPKPHRTSGNLEQYLETKLWGKLQECTRILPAFSEVLSRPKLRVNGAVYENFPGLFTQFTKNTEWMRALAIEFPGNLHGDVTIENILVSENDFLLIDPNGENYISDPLVDFAKLYQSLHSGYELFRDLKTAAYQDGEIDFSERESWQYQELFSRLQAHLIAKLGFERAHLVKFHEAVHLARLLPYKAWSRPKVFYAYYAAFLRAFTNFLNPS